MTTRRRPRARARAGWALWAPSALMAVGALALGLTPVGPPAALWPSASGAQPVRQPDLVVEAIELAPESPKPGDPITITLTIANQGRADVRERFDVEFLIRFGPPELNSLGLGVLTGVRIDKRTVKEPVPAGKSVQVRFQWEALNLPQFRFLFRVDSPFNRVQESDERNNQFEHLLEIKEEFLDQWWLDAIEARGAWRTTQGSPDVVVAVIDSGLDQGHREFQGNLWTDPETGGHGWDFVDERDGRVRRTPIDFHGTSVGGLIAARADGRGTTGVAPNVRLMDLRVFPTVRVGGRAEALGAPFELINAAIDFAVARGARVINLSLGTRFCSLEEIFPMYREPVRRLLEAQRRAIERALAAGVTVVAAAGNNGRCVGYPARFPGVIAVSATDRQNAITGYSSRGPEVWVAAPGGGLSFEEFVQAFQGEFQQLVPVLSTLLIAPYLRDNYGWFTGTSGATPLVSGVVALMLSVNPELTPEQVRRVLAATATDLGDPGFDELYGYGLVNAKRAVECVAQGLSCLRGP